MDKRTRAIVRKTNERLRLAVMAIGPGHVSPSPAMWLSERVEVGESQYVKQDESVVRDALKRLTYVHRIDHTTEVDDWAIEELLFRLDHLEDRSNKGQNHATHKINAWMALDHENTPETCS